MSINDILEQVGGIQGPVKVVGIKDGCDHVYIDCVANWVMDFYGQPWADMDISYIYTNEDGLVIEVEEEE